MSELVSTSDFDDIEQAARSQLKCDGRMSSVEIAKQIGVTEATVRRKMAKILEDPDICYRQSSDYCAAMLALQQLSDWTSHANTLSRSPKSLPNIRLSTASML